MRIEKRQRRRPSTGIYARFSADQWAHGVDALHSETSSPPMEEFDFVVYEVGDEVRTIGPFCPRATVIAVERPYGAEVYTVRSVKTGREFTTLTCAPVEG